MRPHAVAATDTGGWRGTGPPGMAAQWSRSPTSIAPSNFSLAIKRRRAKLEAGVRY
jgi:hypothetical protein